MRKPLLSRVFRFGECLTRIPYRLNYYHLESRSLHLLIRSAPFLEASSLRESQGGAFLSINPGSYRMNNSIQNEAENQWFRASEFESSNQ